MTSLCGEFPGEVFADEDGTYMGDFAYGDGPGGPFGWVACMSFSDPMAFFGCFRSFSRSYGCEEGRPDAVAIHVPFEFGVGRAYTVADLSGPTGLEAMPAMRLDLPGSPASYVGWAGPQVVDPITGAWKAGLLSGDTGWNPDLDTSVTWVFQCWARIADDNPVSGAVLSFNVAPDGFAAGSPTSDSLALTTDWQFYQTVFHGGFFPSSSFYWPLVRIGGSVANPGSDFCTFFSQRIGINTYQPLGSVLIKCAHLYPLVVPGGNWIDSFHGHG